MIASIIKAHGGRRDELVWSASLREGLEMREAMERNKDNGKINVQGLLLLDISDIAFNSAAISTLAIALEGDSWLLGLRCLGRFHGSGNNSKEDEAQNASDLLCRRLSNNSTLKALQLSGICNGTAESLSMNICARPLPEYIKEYPFLHSRLREWRSLDRAEQEKRQKDELLPTKGKWRF